MQGEDRPTLSLLRDSVPPDEKLITICTAKTLYMMFDILLMYFCVNQFVKYSNRSLRNSVVNTLLSIALFTPSVFLKDYLDLGLQSFGSGLLGVIILCVGEGDALMVGAMSGILLGIHTEYICVLGVITITMMRWNPESADHISETNIFGIKLSVQGIVKLLKMLGILAVAIVGISIPWIENQGFISGILSFEHGLSSFFEKSFAEVTVQIIVISAGSILTLAVDKKKIMDVLPYTMFLVSLAVAFFEEDTLRLIPLAIMVIYPKHFRTVFCTAVFMLFFDDSDAESTHGVLVIGILVGWWLLSKEFIKDIHLFFRLDLRSEQIGLGGYWSEMSPTEIISTSKFNKILFKTSRILQKVYRHLEKVLVVIMAVYHA
jgi:hypothetical protein